MVFFRVALASTLVLLVGLTCLAAPPRDDQYADLVIGVPSEDLSTTVDVGAVERMGGGPSGLTADGATWWMQGMTGVGDAGEPNDGFGMTLASGDFNGDSLADIVVGVPQEDLAGYLAPGAVHVFYGTPAGTIDNEVWRQTSAGLPTPPTDTYFFGYALAVGDFDRDGFDDLAVGTLALADGSVFVLPGSATGLTASGSQLWHQDVPGVDGSGEDYDEFGTALAAGDFDGDGYDDLAVGAPAQVVGGAVHLFYGTPAGLDASRDDQMDQSDFAPGEAEDGDRFGKVLAVGDFDGDGRDDLVVGAPREAVGSIEASGMVLVAFGTAVGIDATRVRIFDQTVYNASGGAETDDHFGDAVATGDFDGDGYDDLVVGAPFEDIDGVTSAGAIFVVAGANDFASAGWHFTQGGGGILETPELADLFGAALATGDFDSDGYDDLAVGASNESLDTVLYAGCVHVLYGTASGLSHVGNQLFVQDQLGTSGAESHDGWGGFLLAVESPDLFSDDFETGSFARWSSHQP